MKNIDLVDIKKNCPMPDLMERIGMGEYAKPICNSPFREDANPSFGIFKTERGDWLFKDHATGETGDEIKLLGLRYGIDPVAGFKNLLALYSAFAGKGDALLKPDSKCLSASPAKRNTVDLSGFHMGSKEELQQLRDSRPYLLEGLKYASERGVLLFGSIGENPVYVVTDRARRLAEARRIDGKTFLQGNKSHCIQGSSKSWPIGILEAKEYPVIALVEGIPDFLHAHAAILHEQAPHFEKMHEVSCAPVAMLGAGCSIDPEAIRHFKNKRLILFPHKDEAGQEAVQRWGNQLYEAGIKDIALFDFEGAVTCAGEPVKDLYDTLELAPECVEANPQLRRMFYA